MSENYLDQNCDITLRQALDQYYAQNPGFYKPDQFESSFNKVFLAHDACHIIFGCDTSIAGEARLEVWTVCASSLSGKSYFDDYVAAITAEQDVLKEVIGLVSLNTIIKYILAIFTFIKVYFIARRVKPKWDFYNYSDYLDHNICDIRQEFNIQVV
jgi:ubiquinone biosynthesis protein Coq4